MVDVWRRGADYVCMTYAAHNAITRASRANVVAAGKVTMARTRKNNDTPTMKVCPFLRAIGADVYEFEATTDNFYRDKSTKDGLAVWSKIGERMYNKGYRARKNLAAAIDARDATKAGTKARKEANANVATCEAVVAELTAQGIYKYGRVKREHGAARVA